MYMMCITGKGDNGEDNPIMTVEQVKQAIGIEVEAEQPDVGCYNIELEDGITTSMMLEHMLKKWGELRIQAGPITIFAEYPTEE